MHWRTSRQWYPGGELVLSSDLRVDLYYEPIGLAPEEEKLFVEAMEELPDHIRRAPANIDISVARLPSELSDRVSEILYDGRSLVECAPSLQDYFVDELSYIPRLVVGCRPDDTLSAAATSIDPHAYWGLAVIKCVALIYRLNNRHIIWHEALHTLDAVDCYSLPDQGPTCDQRNCIMQYAPDNCTVGAWPWLCQRNSDRIRSFIERCQDFK